MRQYLVEPKLSYDITLDLIPMSHHSRTSADSLMRVTYVVGDRKTVVVAVPVLLLINYTQDKTRTFLALEPELFNYV